jgi:hypothetical protein
MPFKSVTRSIKSLNLGICNCFLLHGTFGYAIVDTGLAKHGDTILKAIADEGLAPKQIKYMVKFQQRCQMRHRNSRSEDLCRGGASAVYEPVGSTPFPPHSLSGGMIALNHPK